MKIIPLFIIAAAAVLTGCNANAPLVQNKANETTGDIVQQGQGSIRINTLVLDVSIKEDISILPEWFPYPYSQNPIYVVNGEAGNLMKQLASNNDVSTEYASSSEVSNMMPIPVSLQTSKGAGNTSTSISSVNMVIRPSFRHPEGPVFLSVSLNTLDGDFRFSSNQFVSLKKNQSFLLSRLKNKNTLQVIIITPKIISGK